MIPGWIDKLSSVLSGRMTGKHTCAPCAGRGAARASFSSGLTRLCSALRGAAASAAFAALSILLLAPDCAFPQSPVQGDLIVNRALLSSTSLPPLASSVTVTVVIRTASVMEFLTHAPQLPGAESLIIPTTYYRSGSAATDPFVSMPPPVPAGSTKPIDQSQPVPLTAAATLRQGEPFFIRLTDKDQNLDTTLAETVLVTVRNIASGDEEVIRLTETGPNTGAFTGYLSTNGAPATPYDGSLSVSDGKILTASYVDLQDGSDTSVAALLVEPSPSLWMQKSAGRDSAGQGDFIPYQLNVTNNSTSIPVVGVRVTDTLPVGLRLRAGSVRVNAVPAGDPLVSADGRTLTFTVGTLAGGAASTVEYVAEVTAGTRLGAAINSAFASSVAGGRSNTAQATVKIRDDFLRTRSTLMGRVTTGACSDESGEGPDGVEGVRVYLEDGSFVISDNRGLFHFEGVRAGLHVVQAWAS